MNQKELGDLQHLRNYLNYLVYVIINIGILMLMTLRVLVGKPWYVLLPPPSPPLFLPPVQKSIVPSPLVIHFDDQTSNGVFNDMSSLPRGNYPDSFQNSVSVFVFRIFDSFFFCMTKIWFNRS